ncbi:MAG: hypothetical protein K2X86_02770 [Cytophagaceae bacterium]|nr:hypothetical protein [Cytophagaceae bacterium]
MKNRSVINGRKPENIPRVTMRATNQKNVMIAESRLLLNIPNATNATGNITPTTSVLTAE